MKTKLKFLILLFSISIIACKSKKKTINSSKPRPKTSTSATKPNTVNTEVKATVVEKKLNIFQGKLSELRAKAIAENKTIIIDFYTNWCAPCKKMLREIAEDDKARNTINEKYVFYSINAEDIDYVQFAKDMNVSSFPCYVFISPQWRVKYRFTGYTPMEQFNYYLSQNITH